MQVQVTPEGNFSMSKSRLDGSYSMAVSQMEGVGVGRLVNPKSPWGGGQINSKPGDSQVPNVRSPNIGNDSRMPKSVLDYEAFLEFVLLSALHIDY